jgi:membrane associated rhomboid family serine protease
MIIPYGHAGLKIHSLPWVTIAIFVICVVAYGLSTGPSDEAAAESEALFAEVVEAFVANPKLDLEPEFLEFFLRAHGVDDNEREVFLEALAEHAASGAGLDGTVTQEELDRLIDDFWAVYRSSPSYRFGFVPASMSVVDLVTYQFMHGGWAHLFSNLLILYLAAPYIEQRWGRAVFLGFYLAAGVVSALFWAFRYPGLDVPLVGASGSIAGLMGAFLICFGSSKIRFLYIGGTFEAPAWLMLPIWLALEVVSGRAVDVSGGGGVAHWAHVWGFIFGMAFAWGLHVIGLDERLAAARTTAASPQIPLRSAPAAQRTRAEQERRHSPKQPVHQKPGHPAQPRGEPLDQAASSEPDATPAAMVETMIDPVPAVELRPVERLKILEGVPHSISGTVLQFMVGDGGRRLELTRVDAIAVGAIAQPGSRPFVIVDLILDPPWVGGGDLRVLRMRSSTFDPRTIVGGEQPMEAFVGLIERLVAASAAVPLPDADHLGAPGATTYASLDEYQGTVLGVV